MAEWVRSASLIRHQLVAGAARGLQKQRIGGIVLQLAARAVDLHVDGALLRAAARPGERLARDADAGRRAEQAQDFALALGEPDERLAASQFAAPGQEQERAETQGWLVRRRRRGDAA